MTDPELSERDLRLDPRRSYQVDVLGKKGFGKSRYARWIFDGYPYDRLVVDTTGDVGRQEGWIELDEIPDRWPLSLEEDQRQTLRYVPNPARATYKDDLDRAVGLAMARGRSSGHCCLWIEEVHEVAASNRTGPNMRRALRQGRHANLTMLLTDPRVLTCDPLCIANSDISVAFRLPNPEDRAAFAKSIGWDLREPIEAFGGMSLDEALASLEKYEHIRYDHDADELLWLPPLPVDRSPRLDREVS